MAPPLLHRAAIMGPQLQYASQNELEQQHSVQCTHPPQHTEIGTVSLPPAFPPAALRRIGFPNFTSALRIDRVYPEYVPNPITSEI